MDDFLKKLTILRNKYLEAKDYEAYNACLVVSERYLRESINKTR